MTTLVLGATGTTGPHLVNGLVAVGERVRVLTRDPARARALFGDRVAVAEGDLGQPATLGAAFADVERVFVLSAGPDALAHERTVARELARHAVPRAVKLSSVAAEPPVSDPYGAAHRAGEAALAASGTELTALRAAGFMSNVLSWRQALATTGEVSLPFGGIPRALVAPEDVAAVAVRCLVADGHGGRTYQLTGPEALTGPDLAERVATLLGRRVRFVPGTPEGARAGMRSAGVPAPYADALLSALADPDPRRGGTPLPTVAEITGRAPRTFAQWLAEHRAELG